ncbi:HigA family addiction module antitoxin [Propionibacteriaceae bacterium Y2011]
MATASKAHDPSTPGESLLTEFLEPLGITQYRLAQATGLPQTRISEIVRGKRAITTDTAPCSSPRRSASTTTSGST